MSIPAIELKNVSFSYGPVPVLEEAGMVVGKKDFVAVVGPNGSGKTTLLKLILGLLKPDKGKVEVLGLQPEDARPQVGYVPQFAEIDPNFPATTMDVVLMGRLGKAKSFRPFSKKDKRSAIRALQRVGMDDAAGKSFNSMSGGQKQRVLIARALATEPTLLLLDEPTANVDTASGKAFLKLLHKLSGDMTVVLVTHDIGLVSEQIPRCACVGKGKILLHPTEDLTGDTLDDLWGGDMRLIRHDQSCSSEGHKWQNSSKH
ncbi:MAG: ABC transporter ATP-binding protein [Deltaproteobacteria bacterium]|nr:ABC transporter ATP-binding protein [Deltaproteobacteria bacterium]